LILTSEDKKAIVKKAIAGFSVSKQTPEDYENLIIFTHNAMNDGSGLSEDDMREVIKGALKRH